MTESDLSSDPLSLQSLLNTSGLSAQALSPAPKLMDTLAFNIINTTTTVPAVKGLIETTTTNSMILMTELSNYTEESTTSEDSYDWIDIFVIVIKVILLSII